MSTDVNPENQPGAGTECTGSHDCSARDHIFGCFNGPGWRDEPPEWKGQPVKRFGPVRRFLNLWRLRYVVDGGVYVEFYPTRSGGVVVTKVTR